MVVSAALHVRYQVPEATVLKVSDKVKLRLWSS